MNQVAIVGAQCRFPDDSASPDNFFENLCQGKNYCQEAPLSRWSTEKFVNNQDSAGLTTVTSAHFVDYDHTQFDHQAFRMAPREVEVFDPQQRLLLEVTWEALDNAGIPARSISGRNVGVYIGGFTIDHLIHQLQPTNRGDINAHSAAGSTLTMLSNRISYAFNLRGPSFSLDTACSSSLVAFSLAVRDIASGRCKMAITGGVSFMLRPEYMVTLSKGHFLASDGRSKSFDAKADGYGRGEGCGVVILKDAEAAEHDGDDIIAYIDGAGINQDGHTSGITVPNSHAQEALMREVVAESGVDPSEIRAVEAHGTGTAVGDPQEAASIGNVYGADADRDPCLIGSVKSNIGHLEAGAGIAGVIKAAMMLRHNMVPPLATLDTINPDVPLDTRNIALAQSCQPLGPTDSTLRVAVNAFGYGGTNAHAILRRGPGRSQHASMQTAASDIPNHFWLAPVSARSRAGLAENARAISQTLAETTGIGDVLYTAAHHRSHFEHRAAVWGRTPKALSNALAELADGEQPANTVQAEIPREESAGTVFVYTGMGPQWWAMGRDLWQESTTYRTVLEDADQRFQRIAGFSILAEMLRDESESRITRTEFAQPANLLLQMGLTQVLAEQGITPDAVVGHSVGELASAWASGMLSLEDTLTVAYHRSRVQAQAAGRGAMLAVGVGEDTAEKLIALYPGQVEIAAVNAPAALTLSGDTEALKEVAEVVEEEGGFARMLQVEVPYHSHFMEPLRPELIASLDGIAPSEPERALYSTVTGERVGATKYDADYWAENVRKPVRFAAAIRSLLGDGYRHFVEVGPHPVLRRAIGDTFQAVGVDARLVPTLSMRENDIDALGRTVASHYTAGGRIDWNQRHPRGRPVHLPTYRWARERLWREPEIIRQQRTAIGRHALAQVHAPHNRMLADLNVAHLTFLEDHRVGNTGVIPAAAYLEAMFENAEASEHTEQDEDASFTPRVIQDVKIQNPLLIDRAKHIMLDSWYDAETQRTTVASWDSLDPSKSTAHVSATMRSLPGPVARTCNLEAMRKAMTETMDVEETYQHFAALGLNYGPAFRPIAQLMRNVDKTRALTHLSLPADLRANASWFIAHPVLLDGALQASITLLDESSGAYLPVRFGELRLLRALPTEVWTLVDLQEANTNEIRCNITFYDDDGTECASITDFIAAPMTPDEPEDALPGGDYIHDWEDFPLDKEVGPAALIVITHDDDQLGKDIAARARLDEVLVSELSWSDPELLANLDAAREQAGMRPRVVTVPRTGADVDDPVAATALTTLMPVLQHLGQDQADAPRTYIITRNGMPCWAASEEVDPAYAAVVNFGRTVQYELEDFDLIKIDLDKVEPDVENLLCEFRAQTTEEAFDNEIALRQGRRLTPVLRRSWAFESVPTTRVRPNLDAVIDLADGNPQIAETGAPAGDEMQIAFDAVCFGPATPFPTADLQQPSSTKHQMMGFAGHVRDVGANLDRSWINTPVLGACPENQRSTANLHFADLDIAVWPAALTAGTAASAATVQRQIAGLLDRLPLRNISSAAVVCTLEGATLAHQLKAAGVHVVRLDPDPSAWRARDLPCDGTYLDLIAAPLGAWEEAFGLSRWLAAGGHVVDLAPGKGDPVPLPAQLGSLERIATSDREAGSGAPAKDLAGFVRGSLAPIKPVPIGEWTPGGTGATVISFPQDVAVTVRQDIRPKFRADGTYLVTGGFGALGQATAIWLADNGAGRVVVAGRRGINTPGSADLLEALESRGAEAVPIALDTADTPAVSRAIEEIDIPEYPLRGVLHTAGVLRDKPFLEMVPDDMTHVLGPKAGGAFALHEATRRRDLDIFVMFSSISAVLGSKRQANYCAANGFMDGLAHVRRAEGLAAFSANIGAVSRVGMSAGASIEGHLRRMGLPPISPELALAGIGLVHDGEVPQMAVSGEIDWARLVRYEPTIGQTDRLRELAGPYLDQAAHGSAAALQEQLSKQAPDERLASVIQNLREVVATEVHIDPASLEDSKPLDDVGVDSLMALNIQTAIERSLGVTLSTLNLTGAATLNSIGLRVLQELHLSPDAGESQQAISASAN